jgi:hypothetical protein
MSLENRFAGLGIGNGINFSQREKEKIVNALVDVGITASMVDTYDTLKTKILNAEQTGVSILPSASNKAIPNGIYNTGGGFVQGDSNLVGDNIKPGISIFGVSSTMATQGAQTITPGTNNKTISSGRYLTGTQTILGDSDLISANIKAGKSIFGVNGDSNVVDTSAGTAAANKILSGYKAYVDGSLITGSIPSKGAQTYTPGTSNQSISAGQYLSGTQTIQGDSDLVASNITPGKSIFGVSGTHKAALQKAVVSSSGNWTVPSYVDEVFVIAVGGGGSGGGGAGTNDVGGAGGGSGYVKALKKAVTPGSSINVSIGSGGIGVAGGTGFGPYTGSDGGDTVVTFPDASTLTAQGGKAGIGYGGVPGAYGGDGHAGGGGGARFGEGGYGGSGLTGGNGQTVTVSSGDYNTGGSGDPNSHYFIFEGGFPEIGCGGGGGGSSSIPADGNYSGGAGGAGGGGNGGSAQASSTAVNGQNGSNYGAGGGGGAVFDDAAYIGKGGNGYQGVVLILYYV